MVKAVWFTVLCFVVLAVAAAIGASDVPTSATAGTEAATVTEPATVGTSFAQEILPRASLTRDAGSDDVVSPDTPTQIMASNGALEGGTPKNDTLTKADRLDIAPARTAIAAAPPAAVAALPVEPAPVRTPATSASGTNAAASVSRRPHHEANAKMIAPPASTRSAKTSAKTISETSSEASAPKKEVKVARARTVSEVKSCRRPDGFAGFLRSLNLGPRCAT